METVDKLIERELKRKEALQLSQEALKELGKACNSMFATDSGLYFAKCWLQEMGLFGYDESKDGMSLVESKGAKRFYLRYVRPQLTPQVKQLIEGQL